MLALRIVMAVVALGALGLSTFLLKSQADGITLKPIATALMWGGYAFALIVFVVIGLMGRKRA